MEAAAAAAEQQKQQQQETSEKQPTVAIAAAQPQKPQVAMKNRKRRTKNKQLNGTDNFHELQIDVKRPNSVLVDTSIRALLTNFAFSRLSPENQKILIESLPLVDRPSASDNEPLALNPSSINNEFFNRACIEWRDRLAYGEFTNEHQTKLKAEQEREKSKIDPWKARNFEGIWGIKSNQKENLGEMLEKSALEVKQLEQGDFEIPAVYINEMWKSDESEVKEESKEDDDEDAADEAVAEEQEEVVDEDDEEEEDDEEDDDEEDEEIADDDYKEDMMPSPSQNPSVSTSVPTPPETVTSTQPDINDSPSHKSPPSPPSLPSQTQSTKTPLHHTPIIAEATSSADDITPAMQQDSPEPSTSNFIADDDDDIASHVELSSDGMPTQWYHQQEHDYLKNMPEMEPESSGMEDSEAVGDIVDDTSGIELIENDNAMVESFATVQRAPRIITNAPTVTRITNYDAELPQEIFHKNESHVTPAPTPTTSFSSSNSMLINNYIKQEEQPPMVVLENPTTTRFNQVVVQEEQNDGNYHDSYMDMMDEGDIDSGNAFQDEIHVNMPKNVKLLAFPSGVNYINNDKYIIEEQPQTQHITQQSTSTFRTNGTSIQPIQNSYFVGGPNHTITYFSKVGNKIETNEPTTRIVKQESNNNQGGTVKQRIIYEISTEPKSYEQPTHHVTYAAPPQPEIFHKMVNHNGTTTIYTESTGPPQKKTIIQRKKPNDPYTVQVALQSVANNNTIILTPIGNATTQQVTQQPQKSIVHIHRAAPIMQTAQQPMQFLTTAPSQTFLKKQTVIIPQMNPSATIKTTPKYTTVIRAPAPQVIQTQQQQQQLQPQIPAPTQAGGSKIQRPIQKQKVIMSTSSLQQYRSFNQKPTVHGSRKQLHPQHIIRPAPSATTTTVIHHHPIVEQPKVNPIPVIIPSNASETFTQIPSSQVVSASPTVVTINSAPTKSIFVRQTRPQQIFQSQHNQQIFTTTQQATQQTIMQAQASSQLMSSLQPRMRHMNAHRPPPGSVNLERSYQICQAVIQNSPNRHQLNCQLKPPPSTLLGGSNSGSSGMTQKKL